ncbi:MAG: hypothetical protein AAFY66_06185 [Pseudomonadota bacterium]
MAEGEGQPAAPGRGVIGTRRGLLLVVAFIALVAIGRIALEMTAPQGPQEIDTSDAGEIADLVEAGILPPGLPEGARVRAVWRGEEPIVEVWFHVGGASASGFQEFEGRIRAFNGSLAALGRLGPPDWWESFATPPQREGVVIRRGAEGDGFAVWRVETDRLLRIRGRRMVATARGLGLTQ